MMACHLKLLADYIYGIIVLSTVVCEDHFANPDRAYVFDKNLGLFGGGTRLAMPKTILRARLIVTEAWFRGY